MQYLHNDNILHMQCDCCCNTQKHKMLADFWVIHAIVTCVCIHNEEAKKWRRKREKRKNKNKKKLDEEEKEKEERIRTKRNWMKKKKKKKKEEEQKEIGWRRKII